MHAVVAEELAHGAAEKGARNCIGAGSEAVAATMMEYSSAPFSSSTFTNRNRGALLADGDIDAVELLRLVVALVERLLVEDRVEGDGGLAGLAIADDQLALAAADRNGRRWT